MSARALTVACIRAAVLGATLALLLPAAAGAEPALTDYPHVRVGDTVLLDLRGVDTPPGNVEAGRDKSVTCTGCHGPAGISLVPGFPHIAGQNASYAYWNMLAYWLNQEPDQPMTPVLQTLGEQDLRDLAAYYATLDPGVASPMEAPAPEPDLVDAGAPLYTAGDPARGIVPCQGCHGADARGVAALPQSYPRLRGQNQDWLRDKLTRYRDGVDIDSTQDLVMQHVATPLTDADIAALAAYLASLPRGE